MKHYPKMLYRAHGPEMIDGVACEMLTVADEAAQEVAAADGWAESLDDLLAPVEEPAPTAREVLEQQADGLGIKFDGRTGDKKLAALIAEKLAS